MLSYVHVICFYPTAFARKSKKVLYSSCSDRYCCPGHRRVHSCFRIFLSCDTHPKESLKRSTGSFWLTVEGFKSKFVWFPHCGPLLRHGGASHLTASRREEAVQEGSRTRHIPGDPSSSWAHLLRCLVPGPHSKMGPRLQADPLMHAPVRDISYINRGRNL